MIKKHVKQLFISLILIAPCVFTVSPVSGHTDVSPQEAMELIESNDRLLVVDVREESEFCSGHIPCAVLYPWNSGDLQERYAEIPSDRDILVVCRSGHRSNLAANFLDLHGYTSVYDMQGGMNRWDGDRAPCGEKYPVLYFPHIATVNGWETEICVINTSSTQTVGGTFKAYDNEGEFVSESDTVSLGPKERVSLVVDTTFSHPDDIGYIVFTGDFCCVKGYLRFTLGKRYRAAVPAVTRINTNNIYIPHIVSNATWRTSVSLVNTGSSYVLMTLEFNTGQTERIGLWPGEHKAFLVRDLPVFADGMPPDIESGLIKNAKGIIGLALFSGGDRLSGILLRDKTATSLSYPHVVSNNIWGTGIAMFNPSAMSADVTITPYSADGTNLTQVNIIMAGHKKRSGSILDFELPSGTAWFVAESAGGLTGLEFIGTHDGSKLAGYSCIGATGREGIFAELERTGYTGIVFVNTEDRPAVVSLTAYDNDGGAVAAETIRLNAYQKYSKTADNLFSQDIANATYISFSSDRNISGMQINSSSGSTMLDGLPALIIW